MIDQIKALLPCSFMSLSVQYQGYLASFLLPHGDGFTTEAKELFLGYRLQCDEVALERIAQFNASGKGVTIAPDQHGYINVELLTDCGEGDSFEALRDVLMSLPIVEAPEPGPEQPPWIAGT